MSNQRKARPKTNSRTARTRSEIHSFSIRSFTSAKREILVHANSLIMVASRRSVVRCARPHRHHGTRHHPAVVPEGADLPVEPETRGIGLAPALADWRWCRRSAPSGAGRYRQSPPFT